MNPTEVLSWIAEIFDEPPEHIAPETSREEIAGWDSLGVLSLMAGLDEKFGILLADQDLRQMTKVDDILQVLRRHGKIEGSFSR